jgi:hypothetical protein
MSDLGDFAERLRTRRCTVAERLDGLPDDKRAQLEAALAHDRKELSTSSIQSVLRHKWDMVIGIDQLNKHRNGSCGCRS